MSALEQITTVWKQFPDEEAYRRRILERTLIPFESFTETFLRQVRFMSPLDRQLPKNMMDIEDAIKSLRETGIHGTNFFNNCAILLAACQTRYTYGDILSFFDNHLAAEDILYQIFYT